ncbi:MarR family winged helix-turn-helix transcriptional regulator [Arthrobacter psychrochitiniphilus]|uniref:MarR family winged helix-turn-helix transcriptional regulator n=1 Tax=Arthrobacter psychrochitiniphilus TaxID=291045 RepID=UPI003F7CBD72
MSGSSSEPVAGTLRALVALARESEREMALRLGLNLTDYRALCALAEFGPLTSGRLAEELGYTAATTTAITKRLELRGYVSRERSETDRRLVTLSASPEASQRILDLTLPLVSALSEKLHAFPAEQITAVVAFLEVTQDLMRTHLQMLSTKDAT